MRTISLLLAGIALLCLGCLAPKRERRRVVFYNEYSQ